jgi:hypothetical protein
MSLRPSRATKLWLETVSWHYLQPNSVLAKTWWVRRRKINGRLEVEDRASARHVAVAALTFRAWK